MDRAFFEKGKLPADFAAAFGDNQAKFEQLLAESTPGDPPGLDLAGSPVKYVAVIAEPWSGDVLYFLPPLLRLAETAGWEVRTFHRDQYPDLILPYRKEGLYHSVPVFIFFDRGFNELGHWVERPAAATRMIDEESLKLRRRLREENKEAWRQETIQEILALAKGQV